MNKVKCRIEPKGTSEGYEKKRTRERRGGKQKGKKGFVQKKKIIENCLEIRGN